jgi:Protein of unknown function (DUF2752)
MVRAPAVTRLRAPALAAVLLAGPAALLAVRDPHLPGSWGFCPVLVITGHPCPLCGGLRAVNDLARGDLLAALSSNAAVVLALPFVVAGWAVWVRRRLVGTGREEPPLPPARTSWVLLGALLAFGVLRNTVWGAVLAP